jgi:hypothetical protein
VPRRISPKLRRDRPAPSRIDRAFRLTGAALKLVETEGGKTLLSIMLFAFGAYLCARGIESGKLVVGSSLMVLLGRLRPRRLPNGSQAFLSALLSVFRNSQNHPRESAAPSRWLRESAFRPASRARPRRGHAHVN